jgi:dihydrofolate reductase
MSARLKCSVYIATSVDGYIARPDGGLDWLARVEAEGEDYGYAAFVAGVDALVIGRNTYDTVLGFGQWPYAGKRCVVLTRRPADPRDDVEFFEGEPGPLLERLAQEAVRHVYVDGGVVIRQFLAAGLIHELTLSVIPIVLGSGIRLFAGGEPELGLTLVACHSWPTGLVQLHYRAG